MQWRKNALENHNQVFKRQQAAFAYMSVNYCPRHTSRWCMPLLFVAEKATIQIVNFDTMLI